ncbi:MAG TPA: prepilin-type N-terminal cleavage/methylation domain-containing protein [Tepidisphaeraceae bacterium]|nr:prepilin-type N-terminal cleavage/methylation domain-containing protein [Tepidisphaeraceae bacterium]
MRGFTLIEAAIVTAIVGIGVVALLQLLAAGSMANAQSSQTTTAVYLANNVNEMMQGQTYADLHTKYDNKVYGDVATATKFVKDGRGNDLVDASGAALFPGWKQKINVQYVLPNQLTFAVPDSQVEPTSRVTVDILHYDKPIYTATWIVAVPQ